MQAGEYEQIIYYEWRYDSAMAGKEKRGQEERTQI